MSYDIHTKVTESKSEKPLKRVRFSDEVKDMHEYDRRDNSEFFSKESNIRNSPLNPTLMKQNVFLNEINNKVPDDTPISNTDKNLSDSGSDSILPHTVEFLNKSNSVSESNHGNESSNAEFFTSAPSSPETERCDLNDLINGTGLMSISEPDSDKNESDFVSSEMHSLFISSPEINLQKNIFETTVQSANKNSVSSLPRKRSSEGTLIEKQTSKLSSCLSMDTTSVNSADELKNAVFRAWNKVKSEKTSFQLTSCNIAMKESILQATPKGASSPDAHEKWKKSKRKVKKAGSKISKPVTEKTKDLEESKMAFEAWKKKKDELLKQQFAEKCKKEKKERLNLLINEKIRKNDAESAYSAWNAHKIFAWKRDKRRAEWLVKKEREKLDAKMQKNEAAKVYYDDWLRNKVYSKRNKAHKSDEDRPCWTPPGKANSIM